MPPHRVRTLVFSCAVIFLAGVVACGSAPRRAPIVGSWIVQHHGAPFPYHMYVFNADGTMQQANPDGGNARTSDSDGKGVWVAAGDTVKGKFVEMRADRTTHAYVGRGEISFSVVVRDDSLVGSASATFFDAGGAPSEGPIVVDMVGSRVTLP